MLHRSIAVLSQTKWYASVTVVHAHFEVLCKRIITQLAQDWLQVPSQTPLSGAEGRPGLKGKYDQKIFFDMLSIEIR